MSDQWSGGTLTVSGYSYARNVISHSGGSGTATLTRTTTYTDGRTETVQVAGAVGVDAAAPQVWIDGDVPFGPSVSSVVYALGSSRVSVPGQDSRWEVLSDPVTGRSVEVIGTSIESRTWESATSAQWLQVVRHGHPLVHTRPEQMSTIPFAVYTTSRAARERLVELFVDRRPLLLRSPDAGVDDMWFVLVGARTEKRIHSQMADEEWRLHEWEAYLVGRPDPALGGHTGDTLGDLHAHTPTTLQDVADGWVTLGDIAREQFTVAEVAL